MTRTLIQIFLDTVDAHHKPAQFMRKTGATWQQLSADRALETVECLALGLESLGVQRGDRVAILAETRLEWALADLAVLGLGAVSVPIYPTLLAAQVAIQLRDSEAKLAVVSTATQRDRLRTVCEALPALESIVVMDEDNPQHGPARPREYGFAALVARGAEIRARDPRAFRARAAAVQSSDLATIIYTSGTTGDPKGAMLTHGNISSNVEACLAVIQLVPSDTCLSFLPLSHILERMAGLYTMLAGGVTIAYAESMETVGLNAAEVRPTVLLGVPRFYEKVHAKILDAATKRPPLAQRLFHWGLARGTERARARFEGRTLGLVSRIQGAVADRLVARVIRARMGGRLRFCVSGGAPLSPRTLEFFFAIGIPIVEGYGLTETSPVICLNVPGREKPGSVGPPVRGVEVRIGEHGEILTRGPHVMQGYYHNPDATRAVIRDGWFHTGDIGRFDPDGCLVITDRLKDLLVTAGGKKVAPQPIEAALKNSEWIGEAVLLGDRRPYVVALLVPDFVRLHADAQARGWEPIDAHALLARPEVRERFAKEIARVNAGLAPFEQIKRFDLIEGELSQDAGELTPSLKVKRRVILERYSAMIEALYESAPDRVGSAA